MNSLRKIKTSLVFLFVFSLSLVLTFWIKEIVSTKNSSVLALTDTAQVQINASVYGCILQLTVYPEKRIPRVGNWSTVLDVAIVETTSYQSISFQTTTNSQGSSLVDLCALGYTPQNGNYNLYIRGYSHLRKLFPGINAFEYGQTILSFTSSNQNLMAGETSVIYDNKINSLDIATQVQALYSSSYKNDLNQDGAVNSLDLSNTVFNLYLIGE